MTPRDYGKWTQSLNRVHSKEAYSWVLGHVIPEGDVMYYRWWTNGDLYGPKRYK